MEDWRKLLLAMDLRIPRTCCIHQSICAKICGQLPIELNENGKSGMLQLGDDGLFVRCTSRLTSNSFTIILVKILSDKLG